MIVVSESTNFGEVAMLRLSCYFSCVVGLYLVSANEKKKLSLRTLSQRRTFSLSIITLAKISLVFVREVQFMANTSGC